MANIVLAEEGKASKFRIWFKKGANVVSVFAGGTPLATITELKAALNTAGFHEQGYCDEDPGIVSENYTEGSGNNYGHPAPSLVRVTAEYTMKGFGGKVNEADVGDGKTNWEEMLKLNNAVGNYLYVGDESGIVHELNGIKIGTSSKIEKGIDKIPVKGSREKLDNELECHKRYVLTP